ncbi:MAG: hypothetical protein K5679_01130 [Lachnospiraceae bacterium]|nr:hypothetical protein [Lachnospiraceae bacterium]
MKKTLGKKIAVVAMVAIMTMGLVACEKKEKTSSEDVTGLVSSTASQENEKDNSKTEEPQKIASNGEGHDWPFISESLGLKYVTEVYNKCEDLTEWGTYTDFNTRDNHVYVKFPSLIPTGSNFVAYQSDKSVVLFMHVSESEFANEITNIESILQFAIDNSDDFSSPIKQMKKYWKIRTQGSVEMTIDSTELENIGQYDCCKYVGKTVHVGEHDSTEIITQFVAYSAFTKNGNEPFYWMVFDESEDQSLGDTIADYAKKMGYTIVEDPKKH